MVARGAITTHPNYHRIWINQAPPDREVGRGTSGGRLNRSAFGLSVWVIAYQPSPDCRQQMVLPTMWTGDCRLRSR